MKRIPKYLDYVLLLIVLLIAMWPLVFGHAVMKWDAMDLYLPWKYFITDTLSHNQLPLWNPFINAGFSQMGDPGTWYPVSWAIGFLFGGYGIGALHFEYLLHLYIGGVGFYTLMKHFGLSRSVILMCGIGYMLSGLMIGNAQHVGWIVSAAWLPWVVHFFLQMQRSPNFTIAVKLALMLFLLLSGGYPGMFIVTLYVLFGFFAAEVWKRFRTKETALLKKQTIFFGISAVLFALMSAVVLVSTFDMAPMITRGVGLNDRTDVWNTLNGSISPKSLISHLYPLATTKQDQSLWGADFSMTNSYFGASLLIVMLFTAFRKNAPKNIRIFMIIGLVFMMIAIGQDLPLRKWTTVLPFMDLFRFPSLFRLFGIFFFLIASGFALDYVLKSEKLRKQFIYTIIGVILALGIVNLIILFGIERWKFIKIFTEGWLHFMEIASIKELIFFQGGILILLLSGWIVLRKFNWFSWGHSLLFVVIIEAISFTWMNQYTTIFDDYSFKDASIGMNTLPDGFPSPSTVHSVKTFNDVDQSTHFSRLWKNLSIYFKRPSFDGISPYSFLTTDKAIQTGEYDRMKNYPVLFIAHRLDRKNYIDTTSVDTLSAQKMYVESFSPNHIKVKVEPQENSYLVYLQNAYPGWNVYVDGKSTKLTTVSEAFMATRITKGRAQFVEFRFEPTNVIRASFVSISMWAGAVLFLLVVSGRSFFGRKGSGLEGED